MQVFVIITVIIISVTYTAMFHFYSTVTVPGDSGAPTFQYIFALLTKYQSQPLLFAIVVLFLTGVTVYRGLISFRSYWDYERVLGKKIELRELVTIQLMNGINVFCMPVIILIAYMIASHHGVQGFNLMMHLVTLADSWVRCVPTLLILPWWGALLATWMLITFMHYWLHRLAHTRRALWLLLHRPHHITENLTQLTIAPVVSSFPAWVFMIVPYTFLFGAAGKLFYPEPMYVEFILFNAFWMIPETSAHAAALYEAGVKKPWLVVMSSLNATGLYHVLHHSKSLDTQRVGNNNTVNIGPGLFCCWDRLFGTYQPLLEKLPEIGLTGSPKLVMNPLRLVCAGMMQLAYELYHNRHPVLWWRIVTGSSSYQPPISRDFAIHE